MTITIKICAGTACYVMGGADLFLLKDHLSEDENKKISIEASACLDLCKGQNSNPPYAMLNTKVMDNVKIETLVFEIKEILQNTEK